MSFGRTGQYHHAVEAVNKFENGLRLKKPPTAVGGSFSPAYTIRSTAILEYPQRQLGDGSDPTSDTNDSGLNFRFPQWRMPPLKDFSVLPLTRLDLNHPPTAVGGIRDFRNLPECRLD